MEGWILDVYPIPEGMCVWVIDTEARAHVFVDKWHPSFYFSGSINLDFPCLFSCDTVERKDFFLDQPQVVSRVSLSNPQVYNTVVRRFSTVPSIKLFNADINLPQYYFYERGVFPLAFCEFEVDKQNHLKGITLKDSPWVVDYALPPLRFAHLGLEFVHGADPNHRRKGTYCLTLGQQLGEGTTYVMNENETELIHSLNRHIQDWDPDVLLTDWGDSYLFPRLQFYSERCGVPLQFCRDEKKFITQGTTQSFFSYGKTIYRPGSRTLFGRLHIDTQNSFAVKHARLEGLFEMARVAKMPLQRASRSTIGTSLSSMQHEWAIKNNYLIPLDKGQTEAFRSADELVVADRGGLVYEPEIGWHEDLIEYDFVSMYPEIMIRHNVTPEAVNCTCCPDNKVPEIGHHLCQKKVGMVPHVLSPIVKKRRLYKDRIRAGHAQKEVYHCRADAFKWALVCCFGYLGFRNARFGKIEAHECVNAYSREALLQAKEIAEAHGFQFVHAIVDSMWLRKPGATDKDIEDLRQKIELAVDLPLALEGRYQWIRFCPSKMNPRVGVPNRYLGAFVNGETKVRGIELRRHDTPLFIKNLQSRLLEVMARARNLKELKALQPEAQGLVDEVRDQLENGLFSPVELAITLNLSREPHDYVHDTLSAIAAKKLAASGVQLHEGEPLQYIVVEENDKIKDWRVMPLALLDETFEFDRAYYQRLVDRAIEITPFFDEKKTVENKKVQLDLPGFEPHLFAGAGA